MPNLNNIFMIGWEYPPHNSGGLGVACQGLTTALAEQNTHIFFTLPYAIGQQVGHMEVLDCSDPEWLVAPPGTGQTTTAPPFFAYDARLLQPNLTPAQRRLLSSRELAALPQSELEYKVSQYADLVGDRAQSHDHEFAVIHAHDWMSFPAAAKAKAKTGKPVVAHVHSTEYDRIPSGYGSNYIMDTEYQGLQLADRVVAVSWYTRQLLIDKYAVDPAKIEVVHNGMLPSLSPIDPGRHHFAMKRPVVVFMGRLTGQKGPHQFLELSARLTQAVPELLCIVAGNGDMYHELLLSTAGKGLSAQVLFSGFVRDRQREQLLDRADVFVMPSLSEPFGLVALEAAERHTPVIVSKTSGVSEVLPSAIQADFWDVDAMTNTIKRLLSDRGYHQAVTQGQLAELEHITWQAAAQKMQRVYQSIVA